MRYKTIEETVLYIWRFYLLITAGIAGYFLFIWGSQSVSFGKLAVPGPGTNVNSLIAALFLMWMIVGIVLLLAAYKRINSKNLVMIACGCTLSMLYISILREHVSFGDYQDYLAAAKNILNKEPFHERYIYPPLLATFFMILLRLMGEQATIITWFILNHLSLVVFYFSAVLFLMRCGFSVNFASLILFGVLLVNVPVLRNISYTQVNLIMLDLVIFSSLLFSRSKACSSLLLAIAMHLKVIPIFFVPVFLFQRKWSWAIFYGLWGGILVFMTVFSNSISYYYDFFHNLGGWSPPVVRSASVYGFLYSINYVFGVNLPVDLISLLIKLVLSSVLYFLAYKAIKRQVFARTGSVAADSLFNGLIPLFFIMPVASPTVWSHHLVVLIIPAVLLFPTINGVWMAFLWVSGLFLVFFLPVFDCYPWSYLRLFGWLELFSLMAYSITCGGRSSWSFEFEKTLNHSIEKLINCFNQRRMMVDENER